MESVLPAQVLLEAVDDRWKNTEKGSSKYTQHYELGKDEKDDQKYDAKTTTIYTPLVGHLGIC